MRVVLAGGAGALGRRLATELSARGDDVVILTRQPRESLPCRQAVWDGRSVGPWASELEGAVVVNLAGELVNRRPTPENIELLRRSRVEPTEALVRAAAGLAHPPAVWVQMSTLAIYGDAGDRLIDESSPVADSPPQMPGVARPWEEAAAGAPCERQVVLRTGVVFDAGAPALQVLTRLTRVGLGGRLGSGRQWVSWLHIGDFLRIVCAAIDDAALRGVIHVTSPHPVTNAELMRTLRAVMRRPPAPPLPAPVVRLGALVLGNDPTLALTGRRCVPGRLLESGFVFKLPRLDEALEDLGERGFLRGRPTAWLRSSSPAGHRDGRVHRAGRP